MELPVLPHDARDLDQVLAEALRSVGLEGTELAAVFELGFRMGAQVAAEAARPPRWWSRSGLRKQA